MSDEKKTVEELRESGPPRVYMTKEHKNVPQPHPDPTAPFRKGGPPANYPSPPPQVRPAQQPPPQQPKNGEKKP